MDLRVFFQLNLTKYIKSVFLVCLGMALLASRGAIAREFDATYHPIKQYSTLYHNMVDVNVFSNGNLRIFKIDAENIEAAMAAAKSEIVARQQGGHPRIHRAGVYFLFVTDPTDYDEEPAPSEEEEKVLSTYFEIQKEDLKTIVWIPRLSEPHAGTPSGLTPPPEWARPKTEK